MSVFDASMAEPTLPKARQRRKQDNRVDFQAIDAVTIKDMPVQAEPFAAGTPRLIFILSSERSGSTLLRVMLGEHSRIVAPAELFLLRYPDYRTWRESKPEAMDSITELFQLVGKSTTPEQVDAACQGMDTLRVYQWLFEALGPDQLLVDKTPAYANRLETLQRTLLLSPFYIWLIRHPLGVIDSHVRLKRKALTGVRRFRRRLNERLESLADRGMTKLARQRESKWVQQNGNIRTFLSSVPKSRTHIVRFEDMVTAPEPTIRVLCERMGLNFEPAMVTPHTKKRTMKPGIGDPNFDSHSRVDTEPAQGWTQRLSESSLTRETLSLMREIGTWSR